jgi:proteic killer suppression protein
MIAGFKDAETEKIWLGKRSRRIPANLHVSALKKLYMVAAAARLEDLKVPPGNRLESLRGDRKGQHSVRINDQYRVCFVWRDGNAHDVEITDYH